MTGQDGSVIDIRVPQALAHQAGGHMPAAVVPLERALTLAEPEDYIRTFVDEGPPMATLLEAAAKHGIPRATSVSWWHGSVHPSTERRRTGSVKVEPLSERELDVLRAAPNGPGWSGHRPRAHDGPEHHTHPHQEHLQQARVSSRRAAVRRAEELDLLSRTRKH
jgi:LuxR family maltose regulon positive regulatory protein